MQITTFKFRMYPTPSQERGLGRCMSAARNWYNMCVAERKYSYELEGRTVGVYEQLRLVKRFKASFRAFATVHSHILQGATVDCDKAFKAFFRRVKANETPGYPRFKGKQHFDSFGFKEYGNGFRVDGRRLKISGVGRIAIRWHRQLEGKIKTVRIRHSAGQWYACFTCEVSDPLPLPATGRVVGLDLNVENLLTDSDGKRIESPRHYKHAQRQLRVAQRSLQRKQPGSRNRRKALVRVQRLHEHIKNARQDTLNKIVHAYTAEYDLIALEDLHIQNMVRHPRLAKSILDQGWGFLRQRFVVKAANAGRRLVFVNPAHTSKTCSNCGTAFQDFSLSVRWVQCACCGLSLARDHNAALNILKRAVSGRDTSVQHNVGASRPCVL